MPFDSQATADLQGTAMRAMCQSSSECLNRSDQGVIRRSSSTSVATEAQLFQRWVPTWSSRLLGLKHTHDEMPLISSKHSSSSNSLKRSSIERCLIPSHSVLASTYNRGNHALPKHPCRLDKAVPSICPTVSMAVITSRAFISVNRHRVNSNNTSIRCRKNHHYSSLSSTKHSSNPSTKINIQADRWRWWSTGCVSREWILLGRWRLEVRIDGVAWSMYGAIFVDVGSGVPFVEEVWE